MVLIYSLSSNFFSYTGGYTEFLNLLCITIKVTKISFSPGLPSPILYFMGKNMFNYHYFIIFQLYPPGQDHLLSPMQGKRSGFPLDCYKYNR